MNSGVGMGGGSYCFVGLFFKDYSSTNYDSLYPETTSVVGRSESRHAGHDKPELAI